MAGIDGIKPNLTTSPISQQPQVSREKKEEVATGVGATAGITASATKAAGKRGLQTQAAEKTLGQVLDTAQTTSRNISQNTKEVTGLWKTFKENISKYTDQLRGYTNKFKDTKFVGAIIKSPVTKYLTKFFGGALAFFVLVTGVSKAIRTGAIAVKDLKTQYNDMCDKN